MKNSLLIALSLCFFILAYAADPKQQQQQQKAAQTALLVPPPSAPIAIPRNYDPNRQAPSYGCPGTQYGISPRVTPGGTPVGTPPNPIALRYYS